MKTPQKIALIVLSLLLVLSITSCAVKVKQDNGKHKGWYKKKNATVVHVTPAKSNGHGGGKPNNGKSGKGSKH